MLNINSIVKRLHVSHGLITEACHVVIKSNTVNKHAPPVLLLPFCSALQRRVVKRLMNPSIELMKYSMAISSSTNFSHMTDIWLQNRSKSRKFLSHLSRDWMFIYFCLYFFLTKGQDCGFHIGTRDILRPKLDVR